MRSLSDSLLINKTLTQLHLSRNSKEINHFCKDNRSFCVFLYHLGNKFGEKGTKSLSDALKSNTTLTELDLDGENKKEDTQKILVNTFFFSFSLQ